MKKARGRPRKCRSLGSLGSTHDPEKLMNLEKKLSKGRKFYPCAICEKNVGVNSRECKGCKKWVHGRCHMANKGIGWGGDPKKSDYRCIKCVKMIKGVIGEMVTEEGRKIRRKRSTGATQGKETETEVRKNTKRKGGENETEEIEGEIVGGTNKNKKQKNTREPYTEEETEENKQMWAKDKINEIDDMGDEDKGSDSDILEDKGSDSDIFENLIFRINKNCIDCEEDYEATYNELGRLNCYICGLTSHGCKIKDKVQAAELYSMSKGYKWMCYECTKDLETIRVRNMEWDKEEETEENTKKNGKHTRGSKGNGSSDPSEESDIIDELPFGSHSPLSPMDDTSGTTGEEKGGEREGEVKEVGWKECIGNLKEEDKESIKEISN